MMTGTEGACKYIFHGKCVEAKVVITFLPKVRIDGQKCFHTLFYTSNNCFKWLTLKNQIYFDTLEIVPHTCFFEEWGNLNSRDATKVDFSGQFFCILDFIFSLLCCCYK